MKLCLITFFIISNFFLITQWKYIPEKASIKFNVFNEKNESDAEGVLTKLQGNVQLDSIGRIATIFAKIPTNTINTGVSLRDESIKSSDFFDVKKYPFIEFESKKIETTKDSCVAIGILKIKDVKKEIKIPFIQTIENKANQTLNGNFIINRYDYHIGTKGDGVGSNVSIVLNIPISKQ